MSTPAMRAMSVSYPWRCLWRGLTQITITRPCRRMTLQCSHIGLTLGRTFNGLPDSADAGETTG
jgi:hypothetical protein